MEIDIYRKYRKAKYTIGRLSINGAYVCDTLEDTDRGLAQSMSVEEIQKLKIKAQTAIPIGTYKIVMTFSNRFKRDMPLVCNVKGFDGIRIHSGNTSADTEGCILCGKNTEIGKVTSSRAYTDLVYKHIIRGLKDKDGVILTIHY